jgi:hypothetical protein
MSCQDFKRVVEELADGRLMEAAARTRPSAWGVRRV